MLILILIDFQYSQKVVFSFENGSNNQNHSSGSLHTVKKSPPVKFSIGGDSSPRPLPLFGKPCTLAALKYILTIQCQISYQPFCFFVANSVKQRNECK